MLYPPRKIYYRGGVNVYSVNVYRVDNKKIFFG